MSGANTYGSVEVPDGRTAALARNWWAIGLRGMFAVLFAVAAFFLPGVTVASLVLLFGVYMAVDGVFAVVAGVRAAARHERWGMLILEGALNLAAAAVAFVYPILTVLAFVVFSGIWAVVTGMALLVATLRLPAANGRWLMGFGAVVSILWGGLLFVSPVAGAVVMTWWLGAYALVFGATLIALAIRLRSGRPA